MIIGIGTDIIEVDRFCSWCNYAPNQLRRIYSEQEIDYCLSNSIKSAERFAVRFAAREAFFKAISTVANKQSNSFLTVCRQVKIVRDECGVCCMQVDWQGLSLSHLVDAKVHLSMSHDRSHAIAMLVLEQ